MVISVRFGTKLLNLRKSLQVSGFPRLCSGSKIMRVLNVAEKNDAAKNIAAFLSRGTSKWRNGLSPYNKIYEFSSFLWNQNCDMIMTSVSGHLLNHEFGGVYRKWQRCHPLSLFDAPVMKQCLEENSIKIKKTLEREVMKCGALIIWTDCDREGENIGYEIIQVCQAVKSKIRIYRAKFSEITHISVTRALNNLCEPDKAVSNAVDVRSELDLRIGAAFTRFQTLRLQKVFPRTLADMLISYGSCQFPTLGFVVERFLAIERFRSEPYWKLKVVDVRDKLSVEFRWARGRLFEQLPCEVFLDMCLEQPNATVVKVTSKPKSKWRPLPLDTVELEKQGSRKLHLSAKETMQIAEKLYTQGLISYPRTETNIFPKELNLVPLVTQQINHSNWGNFAQRLIEEGLSPRQGKKSDQAHPPIHPTKFADNLQGNEAKVYEFVVRHFLACLSKNAMGQETIVEIDIAGERFTANGLQILEKNYLEVYIYEKWSDKEIYMYQERQVFKPTSINMVQEETSPPQLLTEADLISLMDKYGIGTDATHADHIDTIKSREYIGLTDDKHLVPGNLGIGLVMGYDNMGFQMSKPNLRADLEKDLKLICERQKDPKDVLQSQINKYRDVFKITLERANLIDRALSDYLEERPAHAEELERHNIPEEVVIFKCPKCGSNMTLQERKQSTGKFIGCMAFPACKNSIWFPQTVESVEVLNEICSHCPGEMHMLQFKLNRNAFPIYGTIYKTCIGGCDPSFNELLNIRNESIRIINPGNDTGYGSMDTNSNSIPISSQNAVRNSGIQSRNRANLYENNTSVGHVRRQNNQRNNHNARNASDSRNKANSRKRAALEDDSEINACSFSVSSESRAPQSEQRTWGNANDDSEFICKCHETAIRLRVRKEGPNQGRWFYKCAKPDESKCNFFLWAADDANPSQENQGNQRTTVNGNNFPGSSNSWGNSTTSGNNFPGSSNSWGNSTTSGNNFPGSSNSWGNSTSGNNFPGSSNSWGNSTTTGNSLPGSSNAWGNSTANVVMCHCNQLAKERTVQKEGPNKGRLFYSCPKSMNESCKFFQWADENAQRHNQQSSEPQRPKAQKKPKTTGGKRKCGICGVEGHTRKTCTQNALD